jgi:hypothetical protein
VEMSEVSDFYENNQHLFDDAIKMRESGNEKESNLIFHLLHQIVDKCKIIDELRNETKYRWSK